ncbi:MAG TPA: PDZ domain-containing protein [Terriglobia bacterium]|nr:PDZ domain-containing protein [Terriglobia bacterium]
MTPSHRTHRCEKILSHVLLSLLLVTLAAPGFTARPPAAATASTPLKLEYHLFLSRPSTHILSVQIDVSNVQKSHVDFVMPAWSPGRYAIYNFAKNVQQFEATNSSGQPLPWANTDKQTWRVDARNAGGAVRVRYRVYANDLTGSFSQFDTRHANVNGAGIYMYVASHKRDPLTLTVVAPPGEKIYSGFSLSTSNESFNVPNYDRLIDTPMEISSHDEVAQFKDHGKIFRVVVDASGEGSESPAKWTQELAKGLHKIVHSEMSMMAEPDFQAYTFLFHVTPFITEGDGMEHLNSTEIMIRGATGSDSLTEAEETAAHEFFHVWNVKRLRPAALGPFDYTTEDYTRSLWFAEGLTQYYSYVHLLRSGLWSHEDFLDHLAGEIQQLSEEPGRTLMSAESSSFHAWFYDRAPQMQQTNFVNSTISYYNKGAILGMLLDLEIRERTEGRKSLDNVLRSMYNKFYRAPAATYYLPGRGYTEHDILEALNGVSGTDFTDFFKLYIAGTRPLPYAQVLAGAGLRLSVSTEAGAAPSIGVLTKAANTGVKIAAVRPGGAADRANLSRGDILIAVDQLSLATQPLSERLKMYRPGAIVPFTVERGGQRMQIFVKLDPPVANDYEIEPASGASAAAVRIRGGWLRAGK